MSDTQKLVVQINGKRRGEIVIPASADEVAAMNAVKTKESIASYLTGATIRRVVYVKGRILNIVIA